MKKRFDLATLLQQVKTSLNPFTEETQPAPPTVAQQVRAALDYARLHELYEGGPEIIGPLLKASQSRDGVLAGRARMVLTSLKNPMAQDALARLAMQPDQPIVRQIVVDMGYKPTVGHTTEIAVFYYLTDQWEKYNQLDPDRRLLSRAYREADETTRRRLIEASRANGRVELLAAIVGRPSLTTRLSELSEAEWEQKTEELFAGRRWIELWELVQVASPLQSARVLHRLHKTDWHLPDPTQEVVLYQLKELARRTDPAGPLLGRTTRCTLRLTLPKDDPTQTLACTAVSADSELVAAGYSDGRIKIFRLDDKGVCLLLEKALEKEPEAAPYNLVALSFSPDGILLKCFEEWQYPFEFLSSHRHRIRLVNLNTGEQTPKATFVCLYRPLKLPLYDLESEIYLDFKKRADESIVLKNALTGKELVSLRRTYPVSLLSWSVNRAKTVVTLGYHSKIHRYSIETGERIKDTQLDRYWPVMATAFNSDESLVATINISQVIFWDVSNGKRLASSSHAFIDGTHALFDPAGRVFITPTTNGKLRLWEVATGRALQTLKGHGSRASSLYVSADGHKIISLALDGTLRVWTSRLQEIVHKPISEGNVGDLLWVQKMVRDTALSKSERGWLKFCLALLKWQYRYEVEIGDTTSEAVIVRDDDIELGEL